MPAVLPALIHGYCNPASRIPLQEFTRRLRAGVEHRITSKFRDHDCEIDAVLSRWAGKEQLAVEERIREVRSRLLDAQTSLINQVRLQEFARCLQGDNTPLTEQLADVHAENIATDLLNLVGINDPTSFGKEVALHAIDRVAKCHVIFAQDSDFRELIAKAVQASIDAKGRGAPASPNGRGEARNPAFPGVVVNLQERSVRRNGFSKVVKFSKRGEETIPWQLFVLCFENGAAGCAFDVWQLVWDSSASTEAQHQAQRAVRKILKPIGGRITSTKKHLRLIFNPKDTE
jgi:hypothetical protein